MRIICNVPTFIQVYASIQIGGRLLEEALATAKQTAGKHLQNALALTYCSDGWQSIHQHSIVAEVICTPAPIMIRCETTGAVKKDALYHLARMEETLAMYMLAADPSGKLDLYI